ncbi:MAG: hypothetical protein A3E19_02480 [Planctomycetes bacterium RIFCSPHIGHO2_12_FULL_52_36]|nr:MAG: hypothetical protein A3D89_04320 [Planctomycetes bacterium RIFCSPHIGHO2_02_FULL_52_58]OHB93296.1 MAG: hypothetical protein A3E19_02480 [Planctomycetes bacterium RIFCSPHIGHO2_12_FULL_52_36]
MTDKGADYETIILLKLGATEGQLKSFMSSLSKPFQKKGGGSTPVHAKIDGTIIWEEYVISGEEVREGESLGIIETDQGWEDVPSPTDGFPFTRVEQGAQVYRGQLIATLEKDLALA